MRNLIHRIATAAAIIAIGAVLSGCAGTKLGDLITKGEAAITKLATAQVPAKALYVVATAFAGTEKLATAYIKLPVCRAADKRACRPFVAGLTDTANDWINKGDAAAAQALAFYDAHPTELGPSGLYDAIIAADTALSGIMTQNPSKPASGG